MTNLKWAALASASAIALLAHPALAQQAGTGTPPGETRPTATTNENAVSASSIPGQAAQQAANAQPVDDGGLQEIVVTAEKRLTSVNKVPMSITAVTGDALAKQGITEVRDLERLVTGFKYVEGQYATPVYFLRGVGFNDSTLGSRPTVSVYVDEVPLPFSIVTRGASLDPERVEVLKGPQGTLFGQNATGGAVNYIAAKPGSTLAAGVTGTVGNYGYADATAYVGGPVSDTLGVRVAAQGTRRGGWQESLTRPGDRLGSVDFVQGRALAVWKPDSRFSAQLTLAAYRDRSETQAPQFQSYVPLSIPGFNVALANAATDPRAAGVVAVSRNAVATGNNEIADWTPGRNYKRNNRFYQASARLSFALSDTLNLTSLSSYIKYKEFHIIDYEGTPVRSGEFVTTGDINSFFQELRLDGEIGDPIKFIVGVNYGKDKAYQRDGGTSSVSSSFTLRPFADYFESYSQASTQRFRTIAGFGNVDVSFTDQLTAHGGVRYTEARDRFQGCSRSDEGFANNAIGRGLGGIFSALRAGRGLPPVTIAPGQCVTADDNFLPGLVVNTLDENNWSWRGGLDFQANPNMLFYANVSKGYKAGSYPLISATASLQFQPAVQEALLAYEAGFKLTLAERTLQLNGAVFYYDYTNKQVRGRTQPLPPFGALEALVNVPKSRIQGGELQVAWRPASGLTINAGATYLGTRIKGVFNNFTAFGVAANFAGERLPLTPKWQASLGIDYSTPISSRLNAVLGGSYAYQSSTNGAFGNFAVFDLKDYGLLDLRAGLETSDKRWSATVFGKNVTNVYYWTNATRGGDTTNRYAGMPATYGITVGFRY